MLLEQPHFSQHAQLCPKSKLSLSCKHLDLHRSSFVTCSGCLYFPFKKGLKYLWCSVLAIQSWYVRFCPAPTLSQNTSFRFFFIAISLVWNINVLLSNNPMMSQIRWESPYAYWEHICSLRKKHKSVAYISHYWIWKEKLFHRHGVLMMDLIQERCGHI